MVRKLLALGAGVIAAAGSAIAQPGFLPNATFSPAAVAHSPSLATPLPPRPGRVFAPGGAPLAAPAITPLPSSHKQKFSVLPASTDGRVKPFVTKRPETATLVVPPAKPGLWSRLTGR